MNYLIALISLLMTHSAWSKDTSELSSLASLEWKNRIVIVHDQANVSENLATLKQNDFEIVDRKIIWFVMSDKKLQTNYPGELGNDLSKNIIKKYDIKPYQVVLIGYDGGLKARYNSLDLKAIFSAIDSMPMRIQEMRLSP